MLAKTRGKAQAGEVIQLVDGEGRHRLQLRLLTQEPTGAWLAMPQADPSFPQDMTLEALGLRPEAGGGRATAANVAMGSTSPNAAGQNSAFEMLEAIGHVPLPHYIRGGQMTESDRERYQTVYSREPGSAAAPTAGLHFSLELLERLATAGVGVERVTLHVGLDTFRPIGVDDLAEHRMHSEWARLTADAAERLRAVRAAGRRVIAIGTTSARVLETAAQNGQIEAYEGQTDLFIRPPYKFQAVDALLTNFHLPRSTLLVLVRTFGGDALLRRAYAEAIEEEYRFYSYGDAMLIL
jgi:S-adenosylmethionine:tRNA ribosyltransferase-isomerase